MKINPKLNLVQPVETDVGRCYVHSTPISRDVWEAHYLVLSKVYAAILTEGLNVIAGPPIAKLMLREIAMAAGRWSGPGGVEESLMSEIRRLTNVAMPTANGWVTVPYEQIVQQGMIDEDTLADVEGVLIFFTSTSAVLRSPSSRGKLMAWMQGIESVWGAQTTSLDAAAYVASLPISTPVEILANSTPSSTPH